MHSKSCGNRLVSIVVPVYNARYYIDRCVTSILNQTHRNFELILINDGSADDSGALLDMYAAKDSRVRVIHTDNAGVGAARQLGLRAAIGEYLQFIDADDRIDERMIEIMLQNCLEQDADMAVCSFYIEYSGGSLSVVTCDFTGKDKLMDAVIGNQWGVLWRILARRDLYIRNDIGFVVGLDGGEDYYAVVRLLNCANRIALVGNALYYYCIMNAHSITANMKSHEKVKHQVLATNLVEGYLRENGLHNKYLAALFLRKLYCKNLLMQIDRRMSIRLFPEVNPLSVLRRLGFRPGYRMMKDYIKGFGESMGLSAFVR